MAGKITPERLEQIEERCDDATEGQWASLVRPDLPGRIFSCHEEIVDGRRYTEIGDVLREDDAEFIAHARQDLPDLLAAYKEQQVKHDKFVSSAHAAKSLWQQEVQIRDDEIEEQQVEIERLRERLKNTMKLPKVIEEDS